MRATGTKDTAILSSVYTEINPFINVCKLLRALMDRKSG